jgi:hypothetical protein
VWKHHLEELLRQTERVVAQKAPGR